MSEWFGNGWIKFLIDYTCAVGPGFRFALACNKDFTFSVGPWNSEFDHLAETFLLEGFCGHGILGFCCGFGRSFSMLECLVAYHWSR